MASQPAVPRWTLVMEAHGEWKPALDAAQTCSLLLPDAESPEQSITLVQVSVFLMQMTSKEFLTFAEDEMV